VLYLAEVVQKKGNFMGSGKSELKLLACQRGEQNWSAITTEEIVPSEEANKFSPGSLLLVDLTGNKQVQRVQEAGRPIANILQTFSRLQEKIRTKEAEIEQWNESLTYQSQELTRREMEMEARQEELQQLEVECQQMEQQRQEFQAVREEVMRQQEELERNRQEMSGAWEQLQGQRQQLEERKEELLGACVLDEAKAQELCQMLDRLTESETLPETVRQCNELVEHQQNLLSHHWQVLEAQRQSVGQVQKEAEQKANYITEQWQAWCQAKAALDDAKTELKSQQLLLHDQQEFAKLLHAQLQYHSDLYQQIQSAIEGGNSDSQVNTQALENMSIEELKSIVQSLHGEFDQSSQFVQGQEEELRLKEKEIQDLRNKIAQASEFDRMSLENELTDEQDAYEFLNQTLVGQRRSLREKELQLRQHKSVLIRRGGAEPDEEGGLDLSIVFARIEAQRQKQSEELQQVEARIREIESAIQQAQDQVNAQLGEQEAKRNELKQLEEALQSQRVSAAEMAGRIALYEEMLQPIQDSVTAMRQHLEVIAQSGGQNSSIEELKQAISELTRKPEFAMA
jgi:chromosome segregation ATPase